MSKYYVGRWENTQPYRIYSSRNFKIPPVLIWEGDDYAAGLEALKTENEKHRTEQKRALAFAKKEILTVHQKDIERLRRLWEEAAKSG